jgi:hypothetical protein
MLFKLINKLLQYLNLLKKFIRKKYLNYNLLLLMMDFIVVLLSKFKNNKEGWMNVETIKNRCFTI